MDEMVITRELFEKLEEADRDAEVTMVESKTYLQDAWKRFCKNKLAFCGMVFVGILILFAVFAPMLSPYTYSEQNLDLTNALPSWEHPFGTDKFGRDIFIRIMYGARISLSVGFAAAGINLVVGVLYGGAAGYVGGKTDMIMMRIVDILYSVPAMLYVILIMLVFGSNMTSVLIGVCISSWVSVARVVRTQVLSLKQQEFALAAVVMGASNLRILVKHLIINCMGPIIVCVTLMVPSAIFSEAFLSFVGIGISAPAASWGTLANEARSLVESYPIQIIWPLAAICLTMFSLNFIGDGLGDALDPKKK